jgi:DNA-binding NarL/FixJ family response regulator
MKCLLESYDFDFDIYHVEDTQVALDYINKEGKPDLIFLDVNQFENKGTQLIQKLHELTNHSPVIVISERESSRFEELALSAGASGFLSKSCDKNILFDAIQNIINGGIYTKICSTESKPDIIKGKVMVTERQQEILHLLAQGLLNKQIASELSISINTVSAHLHEIFRKLHVTNRTAAVQRAHQYGLI